MRNHRLTPGEQRAVVMVLIFVVMWILALASCPVHAEQKTLQIYGAASAKVCEARMILTHTKNPLIFRATYTITVPSCPRPMPVTVCLFDDGPKLTLH